MKLAQICVDVESIQLDRLFHYIIPDNMDVPVGSRVFVNFGAKRAPVVGYCIAHASDLPPEVDAAKLREIIAPVEDFAVLTPDMLQLVQWMHEKYYTTLLKCIHACLPAAKPGGAFVVPRKPPRAFKMREKSIDLTQEQRVVLDDIRSLCDEASDRKPYLLFGITGSGKTEVYLHAIAHALQSGRGSIMLVPEIALTPQTVRLFGERFGPLVCVTHSRMSRGERFGAWQAAIQGRAKVCIGPRSAVFAPIQNLGLIIIDEEHEHTYHSEISPKYDARAVAIKRAAICGAAVVLGSATPSLAGFHNATCAEPQYKLGRLRTRINQQLPAVEVLDMRAEVARGNMSLFSGKLAQSLRETVQMGQQAILFLNRRGFSSFISCRACGHVFGCENCRVNYTYHKATNVLMCHYCGAKEKPGTVCSACNKAHIRQMGLGTQRVEEEVALLLPGTKILRMDHDTTRGKEGHAKILEAFRRGEAQVLIGTQMVAKGLDFAQVTLVGVVLADLGLYASDFRSGEYTFSLLTQVSGRSGRAENPGRVFIQTYTPWHYAIKFARTGDYEAFFAHEMNLRRAMEYPPFSNIFSIMLTGPAERAVIESLKRLLEIMRYTSKRDGRGLFEIIGMSPAFVSKIKKQYRWKILVKCLHERPLVKFVLYCVGKLRNFDPLDGITVQLALNPMMME